MPKGKVVFSIGLDLKGGGVGRPRIDITGQKFGRLEAVNISATRSKSGKIQWDCICKCGGKATALTAELRRLKVVSCGCKQRDNLAAGRRLPKRRLIYPATPEPYPLAAATLFAEHLYLIDRVLRREGNQLDLEDLATDLLYRACWIAIHKRDIGEPFANETGYLWGWLMLGRVKKKLKRKAVSAIIAAEENLLGGQMTKSTLHLSPLLDNGRIQLEHPPKKIKFKRC